MEKDATRSVSQSADYRETVVKPYRKPSLQFFGALSTLTQGPGTGQNEGNANDPALRNKRPTGPSERAIKTGIVRVGTHPMGIGLYLFDYKPEYQKSCGHGRQFGVMAEEVEQCMPEAVSMGPDGLKLVDYGMLGIHRPLQ